MFARVNIAVDETELVQTDEPRQPLERSLDASAHLRNARRLQLKGDRCTGDDGTVDGSDRFGIISGCNAQGHKTEIGCVYEDGQNSNLQSDKKAYSTVDMPHLRL